MTIPLQKKSRLFIAIPIPEFLKDALQECQEWLSSYPEMKAIENWIETSKMYIAVQNELVAAYNVLRDSRAQALYGKSFSEMEANYKDVNWPGNKEKLKGNIDQIKLDYPQKLSEVQ